VIGEAKPFLSVVAVLNMHHWKKIANKKGLSAEVFDDEVSEKLLLQRLGKCLTELPGYAQVYHIFCSKEAWTVENGLLTPTLKRKRKEIIKRYEKEIEHMYEGH